MGKVPPGIIMTSQDRHRALRLARAMGWIDTAEGGKTKAKNNNQKLVDRNNAIYERFLALQQSELDAGLEAKKARAAAIKQLEADGQDPNSSSDPLSIQQLRKIIKQLESA